MADAAIANAMTPLSIALERKRNSLLEGQLKKKDSFGHWSKWMTKGILSAPQKEFVFVSFMPVKLHSGGVLVCRAATIWPTWLVRYCEKDKLPRRHLTVTELNDLEILQWWTEANRKQEKNRQRISISGRWWEYFPLCYRELTTTFRQVHCAVQPNHGMLYCPSKKWNREVGGRQVEVLVCDRVASLPQVKGNLASRRESEEKGRKKGKGRRRMIWVYLCNSILCKAPNQTATQPADKTTSRCPFSKSPAGLNAGSKMKPSQDEMWRLWNMPG